MTTERTPVNSYPIAVADEPSAQQLLQSVLALVEQIQLPMQLSPQPLQAAIKPSQWQQLADTYPHGLLMIDNKSRLSFLRDGIKMTVEWHKLQRRVVSAGRKSELILQAAKLNTDSKVLDMTAGFGHDSLILASTGAHVHMLEREPLLAMLLLVEQQQMAKQKNWKKLMARLHIDCADALKVTDTLQTVLQDHQRYDVVYLDPMFPAQAYGDAKVGKHMQLLHMLAEPPSDLQQQQLLQVALSRVDRGGRVLVKRPKHAPYLADMPADSSWSNDALRIDGYFKH